MGWHGLLIIVMGTTAVGHDAHAARKRHAPRTAKKRQISKQKTPSPTHDDLPLEEIHLEPLPPEKPQPQPPLPSQTVSPNSPLSVLPTPEISSRTPASWLRYTGYGVAAGGIMMIGFAAKSGIEARRLKSALDPDCERCTPQIEALHLQKKQNRRARRATILGTSAGVLLGIGGSIVLTDWLLANTTLEVTPSTTSAGVHVKISF
ncbi:MAG: hypothetical protein R3C68_15980 [Myxococcota bacterium]